MSTNNPTVEIPCTCGQHLSVRFQDAGSKQDCACGNSINVPSLGKLRLLAGREAYITNPVEAIQQQLNQGIPPAGSACLVCRAPNCPTFDYLAICETMYTRNANSTNSNDFASMLGKLLFVFTMPRILLLFLLGNKQPQEAEHLGRDVSIEVALPVCSTCDSGGIRAHLPSGARKLMPQIPLYRQLLEVYPELKLERR